MKVADPAVTSADLSPNFRIIGGADFTIPDEWREWLGSIRVEQVEACDLFIAAKLKSATPDVLDGENVLLTNRVWGFDRGLLLSSTFATAHKPVVHGLMPGRRGRSPAAAGPRRTGPNDFQPYPDVPTATFRQAADIAAQLAYHGLQINITRAWRPALRGGLQ